MIWYEMMWYDIPTCFKNNNRICIWLYQIEELTLKLQVTPWPSMVTENVLPNKGFSAAVPLSLDFTHSVSIGSVHNCSPIFRKVAYPLPGCMLAQQQVFTETHYTLASHVFPVQICNWANQTKLTGTTVKQTNTNRSWTALHTPQPKCNHFSGANILQRAV